MQEKGQPTDFVSLSTIALNENLYVEAQRRNKEAYTKSSLTAIRFGFCHHSKKSRPDIGIVNGKEFKEANRAFKAKTVQLRRQGKVKVEHKPPIAQEDLKKLYTSLAFDVCTLTGLLNKVFFFEVIPYFC